MGDYPHTRPLKDGTVSSPRVCLEFVDVQPANRAFRRMVNDLAYDVSELALVTHMLALDQHRPLVGVPVILMQQSAYGMLVCRADSPLRDARDLAGKRVGVRAYTQTTGVWVRGMLQDQFGLDPRAVRWITFEPAHVDGYVDPPHACRAPEGATLLDMLARGELDAAVGIGPSAGLRALFDDAWAVEASFGIRPINHTLVVAERLEPWVRDELESMVGAAKAAVAQPAPPDGVEANRRALETLARYAFEQGITSGILSTEELFPPT